MAVTRTDDAGQVSHIGREEPRQGDGDVLKDDVVPGHCQLQACGPKHK